MDLLLSLHDELVDANLPLSKALRKAKSLALNLGNQELKKFVDLEINGYKSGDQLPPYRIYSGCRNYVSGTDWLCQPVEWQEISLSRFPPDIQTTLGTHLFTNGIIELESLAERYRKDGIFGVEWPADCTEIFKTQELPIVRAAKHINTFVIEQIIETVRDKLLTIVVQLLNVTPNDSHTEADLKSIPKETVTTIITNNIYGANAIVASGTEFSQTVITNNLQGNLGALEARLKEIGLPQNHANEILEAVKQEKPQKGQKALGPKVAKAISNVTDLILRSMVKGLTIASIELLIDAVYAYYALQHLIQHAIR